MAFEKHRSHKFWLEPLIYLPLGFYRKDSQTFLILLYNSAIAGQNTLEKKTLNGNNILWILNSINLYSIFHLL